MTYRISAGFALSAGLAALALGLSSIAPGEADVGTPPPAPPTLGSTPLPLGAATTSVTGLAALGVTGGNTGGTLTIGYGSGQYTLGMKDDLTGTDTFGVPFFRSTAANTPTAMDIAPNGTPSDTGVGLAWNDICDADIRNLDGSQVTTCLHLAAGSGLIHVTSATYGAGTAKPLVFGQGTGGGGETNVEWITGGRAGFGATPYSNGGVLDITKSSTYTSEFAGLTIGTGTNAQPELLAGVDNSKSFAYVQSASRSTSFLTVPLALNPNGGAIGIGSNSGTVDLTLCRAAAGTLEVNNGAGCGTGGAITLSGLTASGSAINFTGLATADPHVAGRLWSNGGVLTVSGG